MIFLQEPTKHCSNKPWDTGKIIHALVLLRERLTTTITSYSLRDLVGKCHDCSSLVLHYWLFRMRTLIHQTAHFLLQLNFNSLKTSRLVHRTVLSESGFDFYSSCTEAWTASFMPCWLCSLICIDEHLAIDSGQKSEQVIFTLHCCMAEYSLDSQ